MDPQRRSVVRVEGWGDERQLLFVEDVHDGEIVIHVAVGVRYLEHLAIGSRTVIGPRDLGTVGVASIAESPLVASDLVSSGPRLSSIQRDCLADRRNLVWTSDGQQRRGVLAYVGFPQIRVAVFRAPLAGRLLALDVEV